MVTLGVLQGTRWPGRKPKAVLHKRCSLRWMKNHCVMSPQAYNGRTTRTRGP
jgi:hypothetical protein